MEHQLKIIPKYFEDVVLNNKNFEIRKDDRDFKVNDILVLREYDETKKQYTGCEATCKVIYLLKHEDFPQGIKEGYCVMGIKLLYYEVIQDCTPEDFANISR